MGLGEMGGQQWVNAATKMFNSRSTGYHWTL